MRKQNKNTLSRAILGLSRNSILLNYCTCILQMYIVKPVLKGHIWDKDKVAF